MAAAAAEQHPLMRASAAVPAAAARMVLRQAQELAEREIMAEPDRDPRQITEPEEAAVKALSGVTGLVLLPERVVLEQHLQLQVHQ